MATLRTNLIAHWKLNEASGTRADSYGSNTLTDNNTVTQTDGKVGKAGQFTAANSEYLSIADNSALTMGDIDFTIAGWIYLDSDSGNQAVLSKVSDTEIDYGIRVESSLVRFAGSHDGVVQNFARDATTFGVVSLATWYFFCAWHDSVANTVNIQVNNGTVDSSAYTAGGEVNGTAELQLGRYRPGQPLPWDGRIDSVSIWKRVLTATERTVLYNGGAGLDYEYFERIPRGMGVTDQNPTSVIFG